MAVRAQKGETSPAVGWFGVLGEFPAWDVTLQTAHDAAGAHGCSALPDGAGRRRRIRPSRACAAMTR